MQLLQGKSLNHFGLILCLSLWDWGPAATKFPLLSMLKKICRACKQNILIKEFQHAYTHYCQSFFSLSLTSLGCSAPGMIWKSALFCSSPVSHYSCFSPISSHRLSAIRLRAWIHKGGGEHNLLVENIGLPHRLWLCIAHSGFFFCSIFSLFLSLFYFAHIFSCLHVTCTSHVWEIPLRLAPGTLSTNTYITFWCVLQRHAGWWGNIWEMCQDPQLAIFTYSEKKKC